MQLYSLDLVIMKSTLFSIGFRPFFLMATLFSAVLMALWVFYYVMSLPLKPFDYYSSITWHAHEMIFGYGMAVVAGFLLTAIRNWTRMQTVSGYKLMLLVLAWVLGRAAPFMLYQPWLIALIDMLFLPILAVFIAIPLIKAGNKRNYFVIGMVALMAILNLLMHLDKLDVVQNTATIAYKTAFYIIIALIIVMAGRVFPMFSQNGVPVRYQVVKHSLVERLIMPSYFAFMISLLFIGSALLTTITAVVAAIIHTIRLKGWYNKQIWQVPLVWILHVGYLFLIVGFIMTAVSQHLPSLYFLAFHAFSVGVFGIITIGMMARVSVGHTGRDLHSPPKILNPVFVLMVLAVIIRVFVPIFAQSLYQVTVVVSGSLWILAFALFITSYAKILLSPRKPES